MRVVESGFSIIQLAEPQSRQILCSASSSDIAASLLIKPWIISFRLPRRSIQAGAQADKIAGCSVQVLFQDGKFQWKRLQNLVGLAREGTGGLDLSDTVRDGARVLLLDEKLRRQLLLALTEDNRLHVEVGAFHSTQGEIPIDCVVVKTGF